MTIIYARLGVVPQKKTGIESRYPVNSDLGNSSASGAARPVIDGPASTGSTASDPRLAKAIEILDKRLASPIRADVSMLGKNGIIEQTERSNRAKSRSK